MSQPEQQKFQEEVPLHFLLSFMEENLILHILQIFQRTRQNDSLLPHLCSYVPQTWGPQVRQGPQWGQTAATPKEFSGKPGTQAKSCTAKTYSVVHRGTHGLSVVGVELSQFGGGNGPATMKLLTLSHKCDCSCFVSSQYQCASTS